MLPLTEFDLAMAGYATKRTQLEYEADVKKLVDNLERITGEKYRPATDNLITKIDKILRLAPADSYWDISKMRNHLFFFHQKKFSRSYISKILKDLADAGILDKEKHGYKKVGK